MPGYQALTTLESSLQEHAGARPLDPALLAPGRPAMGYADLLQHLGSVGDTLRGAGLIGSKRVAVILPTGPDALTAMLAVMQSAVCVPVNPAYTQTEIGTRLARLKANAVIVHQADTAGARAAAVLGLPILRLHSGEDAPAGAFRLALSEGSRGPNPAAADGARPAVVMQTSGTTGTPRSVPLTQANLFASAHAIRESMALSSRDRFLCLAPSFHIAGLGLALASLLSGSAIFCAPGFDAGSFFGWLAEFGPTWFWLAPPMLRELLPVAAGQMAVLKGCPLRLIRCGSTALPADVLAAAERIFGVPVVENYGMTEASPQITCNPLPPRPHKAGSAGVPAGPEVRIVGADGEICPAGGAGEIVVRGENIVSGYEDDAAANEEAFRGGWFHTGDLGYFDSDGYLFITGRIRELINRGGEKIAPSEVESVLMRHPDVAQAAAFSMPHDFLGEDVAAAVVLRREFPEAETALRRFAGEFLPAFKIPARILSVAAIPKGPSGKIQRNELAAVLGLMARAEPARPAFAPPSTEIEKRLAAMWRRILKIDEIGVSDDFLALGGTSFTVNLLLTEVEAEFGFGNRLVDRLEFFDVPTIATQARSISTAMDAAGRSISAVLSRAAEPRPGCGGIARRCAADPCPISLAQQRLWLLDQIEPGNPAYNVFRAIRLGGVLDAGALQRSLTEIFRRHEALRTTLRIDSEEQAQQIHPSREIELPVTDLESAPETERRQMADRIAVDEGRRGFDLCCDFPLRARLLRLGPEEHMLLLTAHHVSMDGSSVGVLFQELGALYDAYRQAKASPLPELPAQYADYAIWERKLMTPVHLQELSAYWREQLAGAPQVLNLPVSRLRPAVLSPLGARYYLSIPSRAADELIEMGRQDGATPFMTLLTSFGVLLSLYSQQDDLLISSPMACRELPELEPLIGCFVNTVVLRLNMAGPASFRELVRRSARTMWGALAHQRMPFERLVESLRPHRDPSRMPLVQVNFRYVDPPVPPMLSGLETEILRLHNGGSKFDLAAELFRSGNSIAGYFEYSADLWEPETMPEIASDFADLLHALASKPDVALSQLGLKPRLQHGKAEPSLKHTRRKPVYWAG